MDSNSLMLSLLFSSIGMGLLLYGKNASRMVPLGCGMALLILPYLLPNLLLQTIVCSILVALPWFLRSA